MAFITKKERVDISIITMVLNGYAVRRLWQSSEAMLNLKPTLTTGRIGMHLSKNIRDRTRIVPYPKTIEASIKSTLELRDKTQSIKKIKELDKLVDQMELCLRESKKTHP